MTPVSISAHRGFGLPYADFLVFVVEVFAEALVDSDTIFCVFFSFRKELFSCFREFLHEGCVTYFADDLGGGYALFLDRGSRLSVLWSRK